VQIESARAVTAAEEIAAIEGVDVLPSDAAT
jgi:2-keto-3-deoxy-L-rhamnonate aldolase RhmA